MSKVNHDARRAAILKALHDTKKREADIKRFEAAKALFDRNARELAEQLAYDADSRAA